MAAALCAVDTSRGEPMPHIAVWNRSAAGFDRLGEELGRLGGHVAPQYCSTAQECVDGADVVLAMLADGPAVEDVLFGAENVAAALSRHALFCDMGTSGVDTVRRCADRLRGAGRRLLDAPVSGSIATVRTRSLLVMAGGDGGDVAMAERLFAAFAARTVRVGGVGAGQAMKLSVNTVVHVLNAALSEALVLAERGGVERAAALEVFASSVIAAPYVHYKRDAFAAPETTPVAMTVDLMRKDLGLITGLAADVGSPAPLAAAVARVADDAASAGLGACDMSALAVLHRSSDQSTTRRANA